MKKLISFLIIIILLAASSQSCKKNGFDINKNPNQPTDSTISFNVLLPAAQATTGRVITRPWGWLQNYLSFWARSGTYAPNTTEETYTITTGFQAGLWDALYGNAYSYQTLIIGSSAAGADFYQGIGRIMKAHNFQILVDLYGNVPYSEALKGSAITTPKYDNGAVVYQDLLRQIDLGMSLIQNASTSSTGANKSIADDDIIFGNSRYPATSMADMKTRWLQFGNSLKLRILIHLSNGGILTPVASVSGFNLPAEYAIIAAQGSGFLTAGINVSSNPGYRVDKPSPFYNAYVADESGTPTGNSQYYKANKYAVDPSSGAYAANGDKRQSLLYKAGTGGFIGVAYGAPSLTINAAPVLAGIGDGLTGGSAGHSIAARIFTATESLFLEAEAINRGFIVGNAKTKLAAAITESFMDLGGNAADAATLIANNATYPDVDYSAAPLSASLPPGGLATIIDQKWFALNGIDPLEVWTDYRRIAFSATVNHYRYGIAGGRPEGPSISVSPGNIVTQIPIRLLYPQNEYNYNPTNVGAQGTMNAFTSKIFWDLQ